MSRPRAYDTATTQQLVTLGLPITRALQPGRIGSFYYTGLVTVNLSDTTISHKLGRTPSIYLLARAQAGGIVQDGSGLGSDWTPSTIVLKATAAGKYGLLLG